MRDNVKPVSKWEFNQEVTACFDDMLNRSIPNYNVMRELIFNLGKNFIDDSSLIIDIGCSNGLSAESFINHCYANFELLDISEPMLDVCRKKYENKQNVKVLFHDLRNGLHKNNADLILSVLTIQFTPIEHRQKIVKSVYDSLKHGGCFLFVEKVLGVNDRIDSLLVNEYYSLKKQAGYSLEQIELKRKSLEGVLVPITDTWNKELLKDAGFKSVDCFWRCLNFAGYIAIK